MNQSQIIGIIVMLAVFAVMMILAYCSNNYSLNGIKNKTVGNGQHGTARWAAKSEIKSAYTQVPFDVENWRKNINLPNVQGTVVGCRTKGKKTVALVDEGDVHTMMIGAAGVGKTAYFLYPNIELAWRKRYVFCQHRHKSRRCSKLRNYRFKVLRLQRFRA